VADYEAAGDTAGEHRASRMLLYERASLACAVLVALWTMILLPGVLRSRNVWPPPLSVAFYIPMAAAFVFIVAPTAPRLEGALWALVAGAGALVWIGGAAPRRMPWVLRLLSRATVLTAYAFAMVFHFGLVDAVGRFLKHPGH